MGRKDVSFGKSTNNQVRLLYRVNDDLNLKDK